ncbi:hypothetical protein MRB53_019600 [Persea americana]|uniref:Uncharacterized protein n=1 Tax=Persea americana TaxID=3435 RepID=A0ACC2KZU4_PERAE|nr:hypothetical protein MRB53_019600 [Persea americana]
MGKWKLLLRFWSPGDEENSWPAISPVWIGPSCLLVELEGESSVEVTIIYENVPSSGCFSTGHSTAPTPPNPPSASIPIPPGTSPVPTSDNYMTNPILSLPTDVTYAILEKILAPSLDCSNPFSILEHNSLADPTLSLPSAAQLPNILDPIPLAPQNTELSQNSPSSRH